MTSRSISMSATSACVSWAASSARGGGAPLALAAEASSARRSAAAAVARMRARRASSGSSVSGRAMEAHFERAVLERRAGRTIVGQCRGKQDRALGAVDAHDELQADLAELDLAAIGHR